MSPTSTSETDNRERNLQRIIDYFVLRRGRSSTVSSRDLDALETWVRQGHRWMDIMRAIDAAFAKKVKAPQSLYQCSTFLPKNRYDDGLLDTNILSQAFGCDRDVSTPTTPAPQAQPQAVIDALAHLHRCAQETADPRARSCYEALHQEILELMQEGPIDPETVSVFDEALALLGLEQLALQTRTRIELALERTQKMARTRLLLDLVGQELELSYPLLSKSQSR